MSFLLILLPFSYKCALRIIKARSTGTGSGAGISGRCRAAPMKLHMWHNSLKDLIKSCALKRWTEGYRGSARGFFLCSPIWNELYSLETADVGDGGKKSDMIKVNVCCVGDGRSPCAQWAGFWSMSFSHPDHISVPAGTLELEGEPCPAERHFQAVEAMQRYLMQTYEFRGHGPDQWKSTLSTLSRFANVSVYSTHSMNQPPEMPISI